MQTRPRRHLLLLALPVLVLGLSSCGSDSTTASDDTATSPSSAPTTPVTTTSSAAASGVTCTYVSTGGAAKAVDLPPTTAAYTSKVSGVISTSAGDLHITLDGDTTPCAVNSFASLATQGYYDATPCHRLTTAATFKVLQCGDPTGTGTGGPGYTFPDELTGKETYPAGTLAMANAGPDTNGSQFFICYGDTQLTADYDVFGSVDVADLAGIKQVAAKGSDNSNQPGDGKPLTPVNITGVTIG